MTTVRWRWLAAVILGCLAIAVALWFVGRVVPDCGVQLAAPMLEFELAVDRDGLAHVIDCMPRRAELDRQNLVDLWLFIPAYCGFLAAFARAGGVGWTRAILLGAGIAFSDYEETLALRAISASWPHTEMSLLPVLAIGARLKFVLIGAILLTTAVSLWRRAQPLARAVAVLMAVGSFGSILSMIPGVGRTGSSMIALAWLTMLAYSSGRLLSKRTAWLAR
jgi:hypothetical protein